MSVIHHSESLDASNSLLYQLDLLYIYMMKLVSIKVTSWCLSSSVTLLSACDKESIQSEIKNLTNSITTQQFDHSIEKQQFFTAMSYKNHTHAVYDIYQYAYEYYIIKLYVLAINRYNSDFCTIQTLNKMMTTLDNPKNCE